MLGGVREDGGGVDGWTDEQAQTNLPLQFLPSLIYVPDKLNIN